MIEPLRPETGWAVVHLFCKPGAKLDREQMHWAVESFVDDEHHVVTAELLGHKADVCFMAIGPDVTRMRAFQSALVRAGLNVVDSYVSLTEISDYAENLSEGMKRPRLYPKLPPEGMRAFCFYPMSKRRGEVHNWYTLDFETRKSLMHEHGMTGRNYSGRVLQLVTGSAGVDDFEWGVTLFAKTPDDLKSVVYNMRYDEASAKYGEFGRFYAGFVVDLDHVLRSH